MSKTKFSWSATEREPIEPFKTSNKGLEACTLSLNPSDLSPHKSDTRVITPNFWADFQPILRIKADLDELASATGLDSDAIMVSVVIRDRDLNKFARVYQRKAEALPTKPIELTSAWSEFSHSGRVDVSVVATPMGTTEREPSIASHKAHVVARRTFKIRTMNQASKTPTRWVAPEEFEKYGISRDTVWLINWLGEDMERLPVDTVEILLNENLRDAFQILENDEGISDLIRYEMAAVIFSELAIRAVAEGEQPIETTGLRMAMFEQLSDASGLNNEEILGKCDQPEFLGLVHAWAQKYVGLNHSFAKL